LFLNISLPKLMNHEVLGAVRCVEQFDKLTVTPCLPRLGMAETSVPN